MMSKRERKVALAICIWMIWGICLVWSLWKAFPGSDGQTLAAWFQAVGSIVAIVAAFWVGNEQSKATLQAVTKQQREKRDSIVAVAEAAAEHARKFEEILAEPDPGHGRMSNIYDKSIVDSMVHALTSAPAHEVGSRDGVIALLALRDRFARLGGDMGRYLDGPRKDPELKREIESYEDNPESRRSFIESHEQALAVNVRTHLVAIQRHYGELRAAVERV